MLSIMDDFTHAGKYTGIIARFCCNSGHQYGGAMLLSQGQIEDVIEQSGEERTGKYKLLIKMREPR